MRIGERGVDGALPLSSSTGSSAQLESAFQEQEGGKAEDVGMVAGSWMAVVSAQFPQ